MLHSVYQGNEVKAVACLMLGFQNNAAMQYAQALCTGNIMGMQSRVSVVLQQKSKRTKERHEVARTGVHISLPSVRWKGTWVETNDIHPSTTTKMLLPMSPPFTVWTTRHHQV
jgi:hypothetical protein